MDNSFNQPEDTDISSQNDQWAKPVSRLKVTEVPPGATNMNIDGRQIVGPLQGFGQMWQKTYKVRLGGNEKTPEEVMTVWKEKFNEFQPPNNHFYASSRGVKPGEFLFISASVPAYTQFTQYNPCK